MGRAERAPRGSTRCWPARPGGARRAAGDPAVRRPAPARGARPGARGQSRASCCSTSRSPTSTRASARACGTRSALAAQLGITAIHVTHDREEAMVMADRIVILNAGRDRTGRSAGGRLQPPGDAIRAAVHGRGERHRARARHGGAALEIAAGAAQRTCPAAVRSRGRGRRASRGRGGGTVARVFPQRGRRLVAAGERTARSTCVLPGGSPECRIPAAYGAMRSGRRARVHGGPRWHRRPARGLHPSARRRAFFFPAAGHGAVKTAGAAGLAWPQRQMSSTAIGGVEGPDSRLRKGEHEQSACSWRGALAL